MKKPVVHYAFYREGIAGAFLIACGFDFWRYLSCEDLFLKATGRKRKVTCRNCKRTKIFRGKK